MLLGEEYFGTFFEGVMDRVSRETAVGEVKKGTKFITWPVEKKVEGREVDSLSKTWEWKI